LGRGAQRETEGQSDPAYKFSKYHADTLTDAIVHMTLPIDWLGAAPTASLYPDLHAAVTQQNSRLHLFTAVASQLQAQAAAVVAQSLPLRGLPVGIKDIIDTADLPTQFGSAIYQGHHARRDAAIVSLLRKQGAVVLGKTVTTEFAFLEPAATVNPRLPSRTPGGSSAGSAAAVAAGLLPFAVGTQTGGSVIRPAAYCGVVGYKVSAGLLPMTGVNEFSRSLDTLGFFAPNMTLMQFFCQPLHELFNVTSTSQSIPSIGIVDEFPWGAPDALSQTNFSARIEQLRRAGYQVAKVTLPGSAAVAFDAHTVVQDYESVHCLGYEWQKHSRQLSDVLRNHLAQAQAITYDQYRQAQRQIIEARQDIHRLFERVDLLITPSAQGIAPDRSTTGKAIFNRLWTALGVPALTLPTWALEQGSTTEQPLGVQLLAPFMADRDLLDWAAQVEAIFASEVTVANRS
jgi:Asp-tRNA(Asn)/Glu-tRNA(Gln) amidotransferase A subunit family amidase